MPKSTPVSADPAPVAATYFPQGNEPGFPGPLPAVVVALGDRGEADLEVPVAGEIYLVRSAPLGRHPGAYVLGAAPAPAPAEEATRYVTFDELVAEGIAAGAPLVRGMPWSFDFLGFRVTHESDDLYLLSAPDGREFKFARGETHAFILPEE